MKIGVYGGTFNPPHLGHVTAARAVFELLKLDLLLVPDGQPPHKMLPPGSPTPEQRLEMTRLAGEQLGLGERVRTLDLELKREGRSYTAETLRQLHQQYPEDELYFIAGGDAISSMASWYKAERIFEKASILAFKRKGPLNLNIEPAVRYIEKRGAKVVLVDSELPDISSTEIRRLITDGMPYEKYLPETVSRYIKENKLYS